MNTLTPGTANQSVTFRVYDAAGAAVTSRTASNFTATYLLLNNGVPNAASATSISLSALGTVNATHSDGGVIHIGSGAYRLDLPDAASPSSGEDRVIVEITSDQSGDTVAINSPIAIRASTTEIDTNLDTLITGQPAQKYNGVRGPGVYLDAGSGVTGTTLGTHGTVDNPVENIANAITLATSLGSKRIYVKGSTTLALTGLTLTEYEIVGLNGPDAVTVNLGTAASPSVLTSVAVYGATVYGTHDLSDRINLFGCELTDAPAAEITKLHVLADTCIIVDDITLDTSTDNAFINCKEGGAGGNYPTISASGSAGSILVRDYNGAIGLASLTASHSLSLDGIGRVIYEASCNVNAEIVLRGIWDQVDNTAGMSNVTETGAINLPKINAEVDTAISDAGLSGGLTQQQVADALKLAPAAGTPADGSVYDDLDTLLSRTAGGVTVAVSNPVTASGLIDLYAGVEYSSTYGNALSFEVSNYTGPDLTAESAIIRFVDTASYDAGTLTSDLELTDGTITADGTTLTITFEMTEAESASLGLTYPLGECNYVYSVLTNKDSQLVQHVTGTATVKPIPA